MVAFGVHEEGLAFLLEGRVADELAELLGVDAGAQRPRRAGENPLHGDDEVRLAAEAQVDVTDMEAAVSALLVPQRLEPRLFAVVAALQRRVGTRVGPERAFRTENTHVDESVAVSPQLVQQIADVGTTAGGEILAVHAQQVGQVGDALLEEKIDGVALVLRDRDEVVAHRLAARLLVLVLEEDRQHEQRQDVGSQKAPRHAAPELLEVVVAALLGLLLLGVPQAVGVDSMLRHAQLLFRQARHAPACLRATSRGSTTRTVWIPTKTAKGRRPGIPSLRIV